MFRKNIILILSLTFTLSNIAFSQYAFDVKTLFAEKEDLQNYKQGLLSAISNSSWASVKDTGEDYSLWLTSLERIHENDSVLVSIVVELRSAAMFSSGNFIDNRQIWLIYHWDDAQKFALENVEDFDFESDETLSFDESISSLASAAGLATSIGMLDGSGLSGESAKALISQLGGFLKRTPSPMELLESYYLGEQALLATKEMIKMVTK